MIDKYQVRNAAGHVAIAGALGGVWLAIAAKKGVLSAFASGVFGAAFFGGNLAVYYATRVAGQALGLKAYQVKYLQGATMALYNFAVITAFVAAGVFSMPHAIGVGVCCLMTVTFWSVWDAISEHRSSPYRGMHNPLPRTFTEIPFFAVDPIAEREPSLWQRAMHHEILRRVLEERLIQEVIELSNQSQIPQVTERTELANIYLQYLLLAKQDLMKGADNVRSFNEEKISDMCGKSYEAINRLTIFKMIAGIKKEESSPEKIIFNKPGNFEFDPEVGPNAVQGFTQKLFALSEKMDRLLQGQRAVTWKKILLGKLTHAKNIDNNGFFDSKSDVVLREKEICNELFLGISALYEELQRKLVFPETSQVKWNQVFAVEKPSEQN